MSKKDPKRLGEVLVVIVLVVFWGFISMNSWTTFSSLLGFTITGRIRSTKNGQLLLEFFCLVPTDN